jgi:hypothetical protein
MTKASVLALFSASVLAAACGPAGRDDMLGDDDGTGSDMGSGSDIGGEMQQCDKIDIVFVVDNSGSMAEEQSNLAQNFPLFAQQIEAYTTPDGQPIDYRVALTTTGRDIDYTVDLGFGGQFPTHEDGENGAFQTECGSPMRWLEKGDPNMETELSCRAQVGTSGSGIEMPLLMSKWALSDRVQDGTNVGFIRPDALLAIVMLTDEDDSSTTENNFTMDISGTTPINWNPADQVQFLDQLKGNRSRWAAGVIAGDGNCSSNFGDAVDGARLKDFVNAANEGGYNQATFSSICAGDLTAGLQQALDLFQTACGQIIL